MGKYVVIAMIIVAILFGLEFFGIVDIPYFDIPSFGTDAKKAGTERMKQAVEEQTQTDKDKH